MNDPFLPSEVRAFVACEIPPAWKDALSQTSRAISKLGLQHLRWVRPEGIHITLKFLGDIGRHLLPDTAAAMETAAESVSPFELSLSGLGTFGARGRPRVVWAGIEGDLATLRGLHERLDASLAAVGFAREPRPFSPHLTLARVPDSAPPDTGRLLASAFQRVSLPELPPHCVGELVLMRSQLGHGGAVYSRLAAAPIDPAGGRFRK